MEQTKNLKETLNFDLSKKTKVEEATINQFYRPER